MSNQSLNPRSILEPALQDLASLPVDPDFDVTIQETPFQGQFVLRSLDTLKDLNEALEPVTGITLTNKPNRTESQDNIKCFWLRERQWLIVTPPDKRAEIFKDIETALAGKDSSIVDISGGQTMISLVGTKSLETLKKGCPLDIHPSVFKKDAMALTRVQHADVLLHRADREKYDLYIRKSFAEYLLRWLHDGALEYGVKVEQP